jgi:hypothetical protein
VVHDPLEHRQGTQPHPLMLAHARE